jgi:ABC-type transport system involved in multi-copper enzyme maturation permease subunit
LLLAALAMIGLFPAMSLFVFREQIKLVTDSCMASTMLFGLAAAVLSASHTVSREMRNGTVLLLLSKPVKRYTFIMSKIAGICLALTLFVIVCNVATLISLRVAKDQFRLDYFTLYSYFILIFLAGAYGGLRNFLAGVSFSASTSLALLVIFPVFGAVINFIPVNGSMLYLHFEFVSALILILFAIWIMGAVTVVLSTRLDVVPNLCVCSLIFFLGLISNYLFGEIAEESFWAAVIYAILPNWQFFWLADVLGNDQQIPISYLLWSAVYAVLYIVFACTVAAFMFQEKELAKETI